MRDDEFEARLVEWLDMPGEGDLYQYYADPYPADPRDARFGSPSGPAKLGHEDGPEEAHPVLEEVVCLVGEILSDHAQVLVVFITKLDRLLQLLQIVERYRRLSN